VEFFICEVFIEFIISVVLSVNNSFLETFAKKTAVQVALFSFDDSVRNKNKFKERTKVVMAKCFL